MKLVLKMIVGFYFILHIPVLSTEKTDLKKKLFEIASSLVGFSTTALGVYDSISSKLSTDHEDIMNCFSEVKDKLDNLENDIKETMKAINQEGIKTRFFPCEMGVRNSLRSLNQYLHDGQTDQLKKKFLRDGKQLENNIFCLMSGLLSDGENSGNVILTAKEGVQCHPKILEKIIDNWMVLVNIGIYVHGAYVRIAGITQMENRSVKNKLRENYQKIHDQARIAIENCQHDENLVEGEVRDLLVRHENLNHEDMAKTIFDFLSEKYDTKEWFIMVYNEILGFKRHKLDGYFHVLFRERGRNTAVYSALRGTKIDDSQRTIMENYKALNRRSTSCAPINRYGFLYGEAECPPEASFVYDELRKQLSDDVGIAVVERLVGLKMHYNTDAWIKNYDQFTVIGVPLSARRVEPVHREPLFLPPSDEVLIDDGKDSSGGSSSVGDLGSEDSSGGSSSGGNLKSEDSSGGSSSGEDLKSEDSSEGGSLIGERSNLNSQLLALKSKDSSESSSGEDLKSEDSSKESSSNEISDGKGSSEGSSSNQESEGKDSSSDND